VKPIVFISPAGVQSASSIQRVGIDFVGPGSVNEYETAFARTSERVRNAQFTLPDPTRHDKTVLSRRVGLGFAK